MSHLQLGRVQALARGSQGSPAFHTHAALPTTGYYTQISTLADTQENVMEYLHVLSRPMVINHDHDIIWTEAYMDSKVSLAAAPSSRSPPQS